LTQTIGGPMSNCSNQIPGYAATMGCSLPECQSTVGCAHRGPRGEMCWFGHFHRCDPETILEIQAEIARLQQKLKLATALRDR